MALRFDGKKDEARRKAAESGAVDVPVVVEWATGEHEPVSMTLWPAAFRKTSLTFAVPMAEDFTVDTLEGMHSGKAGDYLAIGAHGEMYPIDKDVFEATYERVDE